MLSIILAEWWWSGGTTGTVQTVSVDRCQPVLVEKDRYHAYAKRLAQLVYYLSMAALFKQKFSAGWQSKAALAAKCVLSTISIGLLIYKVAYRYFLEDEDVYLYEANVKADEIPGRSKMAFDEAFGKCGATDALPVAKGPKEEQDLMKKHAVYLLQGASSEPPSLIFQIERVDDPICRKVCRLVMEKPATERWKMEEYGTSGLDENLMGTCLGNGMWTDKAGSRFVREMFVREILHGQKVLACETQWQLAKIANQEEQQ